MTTTETFSEVFDSEFQRQILGLMFHDPVFLRLVTDTVLPEHFDSKIDETYALILTSFAKKFPKDIITKEIVFNEIKKLKKLKKIEETDLPQYVKAFSEIAVSPTAPGYVAAEVKKFAMTKSMEIELVGAVDLFKKGDYKTMVDRIVTTYTKIESTETPPDIKMIASTARMQTP